ACRPRWADGEPEGSRSGRAYAPPIYSLSPVRGRRLSGSDPVGKLDARVPCIFRERFERLVRRRGARVEPHDPIDARLAVAGQEVDAPLTRDAHRLRPDVDGDREGRGIPAVLLAACPDGRQRLTNFVGSQPIDVELVGEARGQSPRDVRSVTTDHDRNPRSLDRLRHVDRVSNRTVPTVE